MSEKIYTVSELNKEIKYAIEDFEEFQEIFLEGTISNITYYKSGHLYFSLKDNKSQIKCVAFNYKFKNISENYSEGDKVIVFGDITFYESRGDLQILVNNIEDTKDLGDMYKKLEIDKKFLEENGYFDLENKQNLPLLPKNIGVVTSETGAAIQDIIKTLKKRCNFINLYLFPAKVQGDGAEKEIIKGIETLNSIEEIDLIICGRGGGSIEDLWAFNNLDVAIAFFNSKKPIISAVGHEIDFLLSDFTADVRAATPTQSIELSVPEKDSFIAYFYEKNKYLNKIIISKINERKNYLNSISNSSCIRNIAKTISDKKMELVYIESKIENNFKDILEKKQLKLSHCIEKLELINPISVIKRGYSIVSKEGNNINYMSDVNVGDRIETKIIDGIIISEVKEKIHEK